LRTKATEFSLVFSLSLDFKLSVRSTVD
jgi:hypothetical protein